MRSIFVLLTVTFLATGSAWGAAARPVSISPDEAAGWIQYTVPLPKEIKIQGKVTLASDRIAVVSDSMEGLVGQSVKELRECLGQSPDGVKLSRPAFTISLTLGGSLSESLKSLKNADQAYLIRTDYQTMELAALEPRGLYYASKTVQQLLKAKRVGDRVNIPMLKVTDWPDLEDRGLWGCEAYDHMRWLSDRKMNYMEQIASPRVDADKRHIAWLSEPKMRMVTEGPTYGINPVPALLHLEQLSGGGLFDQYPELIAQKAGEREKGPICYSQPVFVDILADWIVGYAQMPGVTEVDVWMAENLGQKGGCECNECSKHDRNVLEAQIIVAAYEKAQQRVPNLRIRTLTSEETEHSNIEVFKAFPPEVKIWYYHSLLTYTAAEAPLLWRPYLEEFAQGGRWMGVCPSLFSAGHFTHPFTAAQFVHYRMNEFVDKGLRGLIGYAIPRTYYLLFNVEAAMEWSWNAKGRTPSEFAHSWAVREGLPDPALFAEWSETLGPVAWDVYGSEFPAGEQRNTPGKIADRLRSGELPELGFVLWDAFRYPWGDIKSEGHLERDLLMADKGLELARQMEIEEYIQESLIAQGYIRSIKALWQLRQVVKPTGIAEENRTAAKKYFQDYINGLKQASDSLPKWEATLPLRRSGEDFTDKPVGVVTTMIEEMREVATDFGIILP